MAKTKPIASTVAASTLTLVRGGGVAGSHNRLTAGQDGCGSVAGSKAGRSDAVRAGIGIGIGIGDRPQRALSTGSVADNHAAAQAEVSRVIEGVRKAATARAAAASRELREKLAMALEHAQLLTVPECEILLAIAEQGFTVRALARVSGKSERDIRRTLRSVAARADAPLFRFVAKTHRAMPPRLRAVAEAIVLRGASLREAADELGLTVWSVRIHRDKLLTRFVTREQA